MRSEFKLPANIISKFHRELWLSNLHSDVRAQAKQLVGNHWQFFVVNQKRGRCYYQSRTITIPLWAVAMDRIKLGYSTWYTAHEISHAYNYGENHGQKFMETLIDICPPQFIEYELEYKPQLATAAGIGQVNLSDI